MLKVPDMTYLDHAGTTLYSKSLIETFSKAMIADLFGNPHSASASSLHSSRLVDDTRLRVLRFFNADPNDFDIIFVANATAAIKLVADAFRDHEQGFWYGYHCDAHTSLVGVREIASHGSQCFGSDQNVEEWISEIAADCKTGEPTLELFAYPGQSNMTGYRPPLDWCRRIRHARNSSGRQVYTLFDAAGLVSTSPLDLSDASIAPDFTALSFYKVFGFPDLGALIVRKESGDVLRKRKYFAGGTVDMVISLGAQWHSKKESSLHDRLEDGTVPFHSILALSSALSVQFRLYGSMENISRHTSFVARHTAEALSSLKHPNGAIVCKIYVNGSLDFRAQKHQGPTIALNVLNSKGQWLGKSEVEKLATVHNIQLRTGGFCNPGGISRHLDLSADEMRRNFAAGMRCDDDHDVIDCKPTGALRISFGAMSSIRDSQKFVAFIEEFFVEKETTPTAAKHTTVIHAAERPQDSQCGFFVESLSIYPIKSCGAYKVPSDTKWEVKEAGLAFDREWCLVHQGTGSALNQKRYPRMALLRPSIDLKAQLLRIAFTKEDGIFKNLEISLEELENGHGAINMCDKVTDRTSTVCGDIVDVHVYDSPEISDFFSEALGVPCHLARCPRRTSNRVSIPRGSKGHAPLSGEVTQVSGRPILLSNESPILLISRSSVNRLNECIKASASVGRAVPADSFRGNIVIAEDSTPGHGESPYIEDTWHGLEIGEQNMTAFEVMGPCQRCQMICVDQKSAQRRQEPFTTLAKTRRKDGKVWFGMHLCLASSHVQGSVSPARLLIQVGDRVKGY